jgi:NADH-quinone oxidoreductase subunit A
MTSDYIAAALAIGAGAFMAILLTLASKYLGPSRPTRAKQISYEAGSEPIGSPRARFSVKFYQVAILFLVFDIETAFLYPWAVRFRALGWGGFVEMLVFLGVLVTALAYAWRKKAIGWG